MEDNIYFRILKHLVDSRLISIKLVDETGVFSKLEDLRDIEKMVQHPGEIGYNLYITINVPERHVQINPAAI